MATIFKKDIDVGVEILLGKVQRNNIFWQDAFDSFMCFLKKKQRLCNTKYISDIPVWYNSGIKIGEKLVFFNKSCI